MNTMDFYLGALALCALSATLIRETSPYPRSGDPIKYQTMMMPERKGARVFVGRILLGIALLSAGAGLLAQLQSSYR